MKLNPTQQFSIFPLLGWFFLILLSNHSLCAQLLYEEEGNSKANTLEVLGLKGKVKSVEQFEYHAKMVGDSLIKEKRIAGELTGTWPNWFYEFDDNGRLLKEVYYDTLGIRMNVHHTYYETPFKDSVIVSDLLLKQISDRICRYFNQKGQVIRINHHWVSLGGKSRDIYTYDNTGNCVSMEHYSTNEYLPPDSMYKTEKVVFKHSANNELISREEFPTLFRKYAHFENYEKEENGDLITLRWYPNDQSKDYRMTIQKFDTYGNMISEEIFEPTDKLLVAKTYAYKYDNAGNWIWRKEIYSTGYKYIYERQIKYY